MLNEEFPPKDTFVALLCEIGAGFSLDCTRAGDQCTDLDPGVSLTCCGTGLEATAKISSHGADGALKGLFVSGNTLFYQFSNIFVELTSRWNVPFSFSKK